jgi:hypothetical protein
MASYLVSTRDFFPRDKAAENEGDNPTSQRVEVMNVRSYTSTQVMSLWSGA